jgi:D-amino peptidase
VISDTARTNFQPHPPEIDGRLRAQWDRNTDEVNMRKPVVLAFAGVLLLMSPALSQQKSLKVVLLYDMEGVSGATSVRHTNFGANPEYEEARRSLTADVNAAIAGLKAAGATEIIVVDGHGSGNTESPDVLEAELLPPAKMISRDRPFDIYMDSYDQSVDAVVAVAMHAGAGNPAGFLSHTYTIEDVQYRVNGAPFNETMILAMGAARFGIPVIMVSGDDELEKEVRRDLPWVKYASGKHAAGRARAEPFARDEVSRRIERAAREALFALNTARLPDTVPGPFRFALTFQDESQAQAVSRLQGAELLADSVSVQIRAGDFEEGYRTSLRLISTAGLVGRLQAMQRVLAAQPNAAALREAVSKHITDRWLDPQAAASAPAASGAPRRYWGAR